MIRTVLVTGIGGNVGQGILRNLRSSAISLNIIGVNVEQLTSANYLCDNVYEVPYAYSDNYIETIKTICSRENVELIIPSTDYEVYYLSKNIDQFSCKVVANPSDTNEIFVDKFKTYQSFSNTGIPFAKAFEVDQYDFTFDSFIAKPKKGRGSRGILINPESIENLGDEYMIQEMHVGQEYTTAFYVDKSNSLFSLITMSRKLVNGTTTFCTVEKDKDQLIEPVIQQIITKFKVVGSCNIQYIIDKNNNVHPFEINGRISGTNSIRSNFGFKDVVWTIEEHLLNKTLQKPTITGGSASRILLDVIYPEQNLDSISSDSNYLIF